MIYECLNAIAEPKFKGTIILPKEVFRTIENVFYFRGKSSLSFLDDEVATSFLGLVFPLYSPFYETFNQKIGEMMDHGFIDHLAKTKNSKAKRETSNYDLGPEVLSLNHLRIGFSLFCILLLISTLVFLIELIIPKLQVFFRALLEYTVFIFVVRKIKLTILY